MPRLPASLRTAALFASVLLLVALSIGCRNRERGQSSSATPTNSLEAARSWSGSRVAFRDGDGKYAFKLRKRKVRTRVYDANNKPVGEVLREGNILHLLARDHQTGFIIRPGADDKEGDPNLDLVVYSASVPAPSGDEVDGEEETPSDEPPAPRRLSRLEAKKGKPVARVTLEHQADLDTWYIFRGEGTLLAMIEAPTAPHTDATLFTFEQKKGTPPVINLRATGELYTRRIEALTDAVADKDKEVILSARERKLQPAALAPLLIDLDPLLAGGLVKLLGEGPATAKDKDSDKDSDDDDNKGGSEPGE